MKIEINDISIDVQEGDKLDVSADEMYSYVVVNRRGRSGKWYVVFDSDYVYNTRGK